MFEPQPGPRLFALPPGADFPAELARGLMERTAGMAPEAVARVELFVNTQRMQRRLRTLFADGTSRLLPRIRLVTDLGAEPGLTDLPPAVPALVRRLEVAELVRALLAREPTLAPRAASFDLADTLATLMAEMHGEGVPPERVMELDVSDQSGHWQRALDFVRIVTPYFEHHAAPDGEARQRRVVEALVARWAVSPPEHPVIVAGSTGSRGTTALLMAAVANLPQGAVILPGFDFDLPDAVWERLADPLLSEDHPQYRFARLCDRLGLPPSAVAPWCDVRPRAARNRLISMALRPAPVTDQWMVEGPHLGDLVAATEGISLVEAPDSRTEANVIALRLRQAVEDGVTAALITPDRTLSRQVTAALDRWRIEPDDSGGRPLGLSAPGRLLRQVAHMMGTRPTPEALLALLKHPLTASSTGSRSGHLDLTRQLELWMRRRGPPFLGPDAIFAWAAGTSDAMDWAEWLAGCLDTLAHAADGALDDLLACHLSLTERLAAGPGQEGPGALWQRKPGQKAREVCDRLIAAAGHGGRMSLFYYAALFEKVLQSEEIRDPVAPRPDIMIWGTLEARVQGAELVILGSLSDGTWPEMPGPDPWLNRTMRAEAGLLLPERRIGLSAHDFQQAVAAPEVMLTRSVKNADSEAVMSRWLNRLTNLMRGLPGGRGPEALDGMRARGERWLDMAMAADRRIVPAPPAHRPAPCPPREVRPRQLSITQVERLVRDPYAIYAQKVLDLRPLDPLRPEPDAPTRGTTLHLIFERYVLEGCDPAASDAREALMAIARDVLAAEVPWPSARHLWLARLDRAADWFLAGEVERRRGAQPLQVEAKGSLVLPGIDFTLTGKVDRIDRRDDGRLIVIDYKTGDPPSPARMMAFDRQLLLSAAMAEAGVLDGVRRATVAGVCHIGFGARRVDAVLPLRDPEAKVTLDPDTTLQGLVARIRAYDDVSRGYLSRRAVAELGYGYGYDHLARHGEWADSDPGFAERVG